MKKNDGILTNVNLEDIKLLNKNPKEFWEGVTEIGEVAFPSSDLFVSIDVPEFVKIINGEAFSFCQFLKEVKLNKGVKKILVRAFQDCTKLEKINIPSSVEYMDSGVFMNCDNLKEVTIEEGVYDIPFSCFYECSSLKSITIPSSVNSINISSFGNCVELEEVILNEGLSTLDFHAFENCSKLSKIYIPDSVKNFDSRAFDRCKSLSELSLPKGFANSLIGLDYLDFSSINILNNGRILLLGQDKNLQEYDNIVDTYNYEDIIKIYAAFPGINMELFLHDSEKMKCLLKRANYFNKLEMSFPCELLDTYELFDKYTNKNFKMAHRLIDQFNLELDEVEGEAFYKLANNIGLLEPASVTVDIGGKKVPVCVVAHECLQRLFNNDYLNTFDLRYYYLPLMLDEYNEEFMKFMQKKDLFPGLKKILMNKPEIISSIYRWYKERKELVFPCDSNNPKIPQKEEDRYKMAIFVEGENETDNMKWKYPTLKMFVNELGGKKITSVPEGYEELAEYLEAFGYNQKHFDKAVEIDLERKEKGIRDHILDIALKESNISSPEEYMAQTEYLRNEILKESSQILNRQSSNFTYEMLSKSSYKNFGIGVFTNCCATLYAAGAGAQRASIVDKNMQSLVVRDDKNNIVCFGIIYVNREKGYAVVNNLEVKHKYKNLPLETKDIYDKAIEGIEAFVKEYNKENPAKPIEIVTCGTSPSWLSQADGINKHIMQNQKIKNLPAPDFDDYKYAGSKLWPGDWHRDQFVIYDGKKRGKNR